MNAFNDDEDLKTKYLASAAGEAGRTCAPADYPLTLGIPEHIAWLEDHPIVGSAWRSRLLGAIRVSADLSAVWPTFVGWLLADSVHGVASARPVADRAGRAGHADAVIGLVMRVVVAIQHHDDVSIADWERIIADAKQVRESVRADSDSRAAGLDVIAEAVVWLVTAQLRAAWVPEALSWVGAVSSMGGGDDRLREWVDAARDRLVEIVVSIAPPAGGAGSREG